jgi:hypothetical protein
MFLPPTMLPHRLRVLVDPPLEFPAASDDAPQLTSSSRWSRLRTAGRVTPPAPRSPLRRSSACTD